MTAADAELTAPRLSLVIPCYNERKNLPLLVARIAEKFADCTDVEVILVDNGSSDGSSPLFLRAAAEQRVIRTVRVEVNQGYGFGIMSGLDAARGEFLGFCHADMQTDPADALVALQLIRQSPRPEQLYVKGRRCGHVGLRDRPLARSVVGHQRPAQRVPACVLRSREGRRAS
jgi:glycosyltransferase involved in cell wall biosynthesis